MKQISLIEVRTISSGYKAVMDQYNRILNHALTLAKNKLLLWGADGQPPAGDWLTVLWRSHDTGSRDNVISIPHWETLTQSSSQRRV